MPGRWEELTSRPKESFFGGIGSPVSKHSHTIKVSCIQQHAKNGAIIGVVIYHFFGAYRHEELAELHEISAPCPHRCLLARLLWLLNLHSPNLPEAAEMSLSSGIDCNLVFVDLQHVAFEM